MKTIKIIYGNLRNNIAGSILAICCLFFLFSCGYQFSGSGKLPDGIKSIYIQAFENRSLETRIENVFSNDLISEFKKRDKALIKRQDDADALLIGNISSVAVTTIAHSNSNTSFQRRVTVTIDMKLVLREGNHIIKERQIIESEAYDVNSGDRFITDQSRRDALERISERFSENTCKWLTEEF